MIPFFDSTGMVYMHWVPTALTVNKEYYVEVLREFRKRFRRKRPAEQYTSPQLHPCHRLFDQVGIRTVPPPPYSPDLAPCDFCLFLKLKEKLSAWRYETIELMKGAVTKDIDTLTQEDFHRVFHKLLERYNKCIAAREDYFEGD